MANVQSAGVQRLTVLTAESVPEKAWKMDGGSSGITPPFVLISAQAKLVELVNGRPGVYEKPIAIRCFDLAAAASLVVGSQIDGVLFSEAKGKAGEKTNWHLGQFTVVGAPKKPA